MRAARHQAGEVRHVDHQLGAHLVGDRAEGGKVDGARIGAAARHDHLGLVLAREARHLVHVDAMVLPPHRIGHHLEPLARHVHRRAVRQVPARRQAQPHEGVARLHQRHEGGLVGGRARVRLHVGEAALEHLLGALDRQRLDLVDVLAAAVVAVAGIALGVLVGEHRAGRLQHRARHHVLRCDQLDLILLAFELAADHAGDLRIALGERGGEEARVRRLGAPGCGGHGKSLILRVACPSWAAPSYHALRIRNKTAAVRQAPVSTCLARESRPSPPL